jgi:HlyD family secretion protein
LRVTLGSGVSWGGEGTLMDVPRPEWARAKKKRQIVYSGLGIAAVLLVTLGLSRLKPAPPTVERATVVIDTVKRGPMVREVRGLGTLVPVDIRWIPASTDGRVERIIVQPGSKVSTDTMILELSNPELQLQALDAESQFRSAEAACAELKVRLESQRLDQQATAAKVEAEYHQAQLKADTDEQLAQQGLVPDLTRKLSRLASDELAHRNDIEQKRASISGDSEKAQLAVAEATLEQRRAEAELRRSQFRSLRVRAGMDGVLQLVGVEVGQRVTPGTNLARVAQPERLKAVIRIPETQARDVQLGLPAAIDTRNGVVQGSVSRIDPAAQGGTVTVDVALGGSLPRGARPDLTVDGTIELERLADVLFVGRPAQGQGEGLVSLFRVGEDGRTASRVRVHLGHSSVSTVQVVDGLAVGDSVILSDTSTWDAFERIRLN